MEFAFSSLCVKHIKSHKYITFHAELLPLSFFAFYSPLMSKIVKISLNV